MFPNWSRSSLGVPRECQFIIESHSEHFLGRLQRRIAEEELSPDDAALYFVHTDSDGAHIEELMIVNGILEGSEVDDGPRVTEMKSALTVGGLRCLLQEQEKLRNAGHICSSSCRENTRFKTLWRRPGAMPATSPAAAPAHVCIGKRLRGVVEPNPSSVRSSEGTMFRRPAPVSEVARGVDQSHV